MLDNNLNLDEDDEILLNAFSEDKLEDKSAIKRPNETERTDEFDLPKKNKTGCWDNESSSKIIYQKSNYAKCYTSNMAQRLFPGPAGLLSDENGSAASSQVTICSQRSTSIFQDGPWKEMSKDFKISDSLYLYDRFNIDWIKREANSNAFAIQKAPFLAGILASLEVSMDKKHKSVNITLKDLTGTIQGNILHTLYEQHATHFILGAVLILVEFGVLSCSCDKCDNHHITITSKNLSAIYSSDKINMINKIEPYDIIKEFEKRKKEITGNHRVLNYNFNRQSYENICKRSQNISSSNIFLVKNLKKTYSSESSLNNTGSLLRNRSKPLFAFKKNPTTCTDSLANERTAVQQSSDSEERFKPESKALNKDQTNCDNLSKPKKLFCFKKVNLPKVDINNCDSLINCDKDLIKDNYINQVSIKTVKTEEEAVWKEALENVDLSSFFSDDF